MRKTKQVPDFFNWGIRALALFQLYLAYLVMTGTGLGFEALDLSIKASATLILAFLAYLLWVSTGEVSIQVKIKVALGCIAVGLLPLLMNLTELMIGNWILKDFVLLAYVLIGSGALINEYFKTEKNEN